MKRRTLTIRQWLHRPGFLRERQGSLLGERNEGSLGIIDIADGPIRWINVCVAGVDREYPYGGSAWHYSAFRVPDSRVTGDLFRFHIETMRRKKPSLLGKVVDLHWEGDDLGLLIIDRLNTDGSLKNMIMRSRALSIITFPRLHCWLLITTTTRAPSIEVWQGYQRIAHRLLDTPIPPNT